MKQLEDINTKLDMLINMLSGTKKRRKVGVIIGVGYPGTDHENAICPHNARIMANFLRKHNYEINLMADTECATPRHRSKDRSNPISSGHNYNVIRKDPSPPRQDITTFPSLTHILLPSSGDITVELLPKKNVILSQIESLLSSSDIGSILIYFSGIGMTLPERDTHRHVILPCDHDISGTISMDMLNDLFNTKNRQKIKLLVVIDSYSNKEISGLKGVPRPVDNNVIYFVTYNDRRDRGTDECGIVTYLFIDYYVYKIYISELSSLISSKLKYQTCEFLAYDHNATISL